jgi:hypothetical protein
MERTIVSSFISRAPEDTQEAVVDSIGSQRPE